MNQPSSVNAAGFKHLMDGLKENVFATYAELKASADKKGLVVWPIMYGKAQLDLGIVQPHHKTKKVVDDDNDLSAICDAVIKQSEEVGVLRSTLQKIKRVLAESAV